jgi:hypothetical protein
MTRRCTAEDAEKVAAYVLDAAADSTRAADRAYSNAVTDLLGSFRGKSPMNGLAGSAPSRR